MAQALPVKVEGLYTGVPAKASAIRRVGLACNIGGNGGVPARALLQALENQWVIG